MISSALYILLAISSAPLVQCLSLTHWFKIRRALQGGVAFENFEVRQRYRPGQVFIFGVTAKEPWEFEPTIPEVVHFESARPSATGMVEK
jgi:hypothetical protein